MKRNSLPQEYLYIQDGSAVFHALTNLPSTFSEIYLRLFDQMVAK